MPTVVEPDEIADAPNAPTLDDKTPPIKKTAESKVSLDADAVPVCFVPHPHAAHSRPSVPRQQVAQRRLALPNAMPCCRACVTHDCIACAPHWLTLCSPLGSPLGSTRGSSDKASTLRLIA